VPWGLSIDALKAALEHINSPYGNQFIDEQLLKVINLMTAQRYIQAFLNI
jgi:predicted P-loop ATPase